jgi:hypothetical protein
MGLCNRVVWLAGGQCKMVGPTREVSDAYLATTSLQVERRTDLEKIIRHETNGIRAKLTALEWLDGIPLKHGASARVRLEVKFTGSVPDVQLSLGFSTVEGVRVATFDTDSAGEISFSVPGDCTRTFDLAIDSLPFNPGLYQIDVSCRSGDNHLLDWLRGVASMEVVPGENTPVHFDGKESSVRLRGQWTAKPC